MTDQNILLYLLCANALGACLAVWNRRARRRQNALLCAVCLAGGAAGVALVSFLAERRATKENLTVRVFSLSALLIQLVCCALLRGAQRGTLTFSGAALFRRHPLLLWYLLLMNFITFAAFGFDKRRAVRSGPRVRIVTLLGLAAAGGSVGGLFGMRVFHHKTRQPYFSVGMPCILLAQAALLLWFLCR